MSRRNKRTDPKSDKTEARRPARRATAPLPEVMLARRPVSVSSAPSPSQAATPPSAPAAEAHAPPVPNKRAARIVGAAPVADETELERRQLLERVLDSESPGAITRAAKAYRKAGFEFPDEQLVQLKLLEHSDEAEVQSALAVLAGLLDEQAPIKLPVFEQRLKRLEDGAEEAETRSRAAELRRALRT